MIGWNFQAKRNLPILLALVVLMVVLIIKLMPSLAHEAVSQQGIPVSYHVLKPEMIQPSIVGFGEIEANVQLKSIAEVSGKVVYVHPALKKGELFSKNALLLKLDDSDARLRQAQAQAAVASAKLALAAKQIELKNTQLDIELSQHKLTITESEFARIERLFQQSTVAKAQLDNAQQALLINKQELQQLENKKSLFPLEISALEASIKQVEADLTQSELAIARAEVRLPFTGRIQQVHVEQGQFVSQGTPLFAASDIAKVLINAQFSYQAFHEFSGFFATPPSVATLSSQGMQSYLSEQILSADISLLGNDGQIWQGRIERFSDALNPRSQTIGVVVSVANSYQHIEPGERLPLLTGMRAKVRLSAKAQEFIAIPRHLVRNGFALFADENNQLLKLAVGNALKQENAYLFKVAAMSQQKLITTDVFPIVEGMLLQLEQSHTQS